MSQSNQHHISPVKVILVALLLAGIIAAIALAGYVLGAVHQPFASVWNSLRPHEQTQDPPSGQPTPP